MRLNIFEILEVSDNGVSFVTEDEPDGRVIFKNFCRDVTESKMLLVHEASRGLKVLKLRDYYTHKVLARCVYSEKDI